MASWNMGGGVFPNDFPNDFESLLQEDSDSDKSEVECLEECDSEDEGLEADDKTIIYAEDEGLEVEVEDEVLEMELMRPEAECLDQESEGNVSPSILHGSYPTLSPPCASYSTAFAADSPPPVILPSDVIITVHSLEADPALGDDDITMEEDVFHLPNEHQLFERVEDVKQAQPQRRQRGQRGQRQSRGQRRQRGLGSRRPRTTGGQRAQRQPEIRGSQWVRGDRIIEVHVNDDDVSEELRAMVMEVVRRREARRLTERRQRLREAEEDEEWVDADDGQDDALFAGTEISTRFEWSSMTDYQGERERFLPRRTGAVVKTKNAYGAFRQYWDNSILSHIVTETNRYAAGLASSSPAFAQSWYDTNVHEILILFSFWMMLGIIRMPSTKSCFSTNPLLETNVFRNMFSRLRYFDLCRALHFNDNSKKPTDSTDRLFCFGPILNHLNSRFKKAYIPSQNICIDESLTLWKGNLSFRQYIKTKASRFGVKTFELCESSTGYLWSFFVYIGADTTYDAAFPSILPKSTSTVLKLVHPLLDKGYTLFMDNWFNSPLLARFLKARKTDCVGTLRANCRDVPPLLSLCQLKDGQFVARHSGDVVVMAFQDKKRKINIISTYHGNSQGRMVEKADRVTLFKPQIILDYNKSMGGVDRKDQMLEPYLLERKRCAKWNMKVFKRLLNCSILNAHILLRSSTAHSKAHLVFRLELVEQILEHHLQHMPKAAPARTASSGLTHSREVTGRIHSPQLINVFLNSGVRSRRRCVWCSKHGTLHRRTTYVCSECDAPLCLDPCFREFHSSS